MISLKHIKETIKEKYSQIARNGGGCGCSSSCCASTNSQEISKSIGYSDAEINNVVEANLGLGCGNPAAQSEMKDGDTVLDLGSGAGFDAFLAAKKVGRSGKVIGVDITEAMIEKAQTNAKKYGYYNTEFRLGDIEDLPLGNETVDVIISNCVINLSPDKEKVFSEAFRVLKKGGKAYISDIVLLRELSSEQKRDKGLLVGCVAGALLLDEYIKKIERAGFAVRILGEDREISRRQYGGIALESLKIEAIKPQV